MDEKPPIPEKLLAKMQRELTSCHHDENVGVPIGARSMAFRVLSFFADEDANAEKLGLGKVYTDSTAWARENCMNPVRSARDRRGES